MSKTITGTVERINSRIVKTKNGDVPAYSILVNGEWYGHGFQKPDFREGTEVKFTAGENARGYWDVEGTVGVVKTAPPASSGNSSTGAAALSNRDKSITLQTAYKVAPMIVDTMIRAEVLAFPKTKKEASQEALLELTDRIAYELQATFLEPDRYNPLSEDVEGEEEYGEFDE